MQKLQEKKIQDPHVKDQHYCGNPECQRARKTEWERKRNQTNSAYKKRQQESKKRWRKKRPADKYMAEYRLAHPDYTQDNREKQIIRNRKRAEKVSKNACFEKIVKMDALSAKSPVYVMNSVKLDAPSTEIVKMDTLFVQFTLAEGESHNYVSKNT